MERPENKAEFIPVTTSCPDLVSIFLDLGMGYFSEFDSPADFDPEKFLHSILKRQEEPDRWLFLLRHGGKHIGFVHAKIDRDEHPGWGYILEFFIVPDKRRAGWGCTLFNFIVKTLQSREVDHLWLGAVPGAEAFWYSLGFKKTGEKESSGLDIMALSM